MNEYDVLDRVRRSLGRTGPLTAPPVPPALDEPIVRLVHTDLGLPELFAKRAAEMKMLVARIYAEELLPQLIEFLQERKCSRVALPVSKLLENLNVLQGLRDAGFEARRWDEMTPDETYDIDCGITDATYAVAETGSIVIRSTPEHGRSISLVPMYHVAVLEPKNFVPDLVDLFERLAKDGVGGSITLITGPSKTADIEMNVVTGVHGPNVVKAFILS